MNGRLTKKLNFMATITLIIVEIMLFYLKRTLFYKEVYDGNIL